MQRYLLGMAILVAAAAFPAPPGAGEGLLQPRIVNGLLTSDYPTTGALLSGSDPGSATAWCSGTLIGCETFLTAAHCVESSLPSDHLVFLQHAGFFGVASIAIHPSYSFPVGDVAVLKLATPVDGIAPTALNAVATPPFGTPGTIAGFGRSGGTSYDYGLKREGQVLTESCTGGISNTTSVCWSFLAPVGPPGDDSNTCNADSGGPLFVDLGAGTTVAGITSGGSGSSCLAPDYSYDANVYFYLSWIEAQGGPDLQNTSCGALPQVGDPVVAVHGFSGDVSASKPEGRHSLEVPAGADRLRVSMNASEESSNDFDLYVKAGSPPTLSDYDCREYGANQWGACAFASPSAGTWHVLVNRYAGSGTYQATATVFGPAAPPPACSDGLDNDADGLVDFPADPGCWDATWPLENPACDDGIDNDGDGGIDAGGTPPDLECAGQPWRNRERSGTGRCGLLGIEVLGVGGLARLAARSRRRRRR